MNTLYPIFLKLHELNTIIIGGGEVGFEKLSFMLASSPQANITLLAQEVKPAIYQLLNQQTHHHITIVQKLFQPFDLHGFNLAVAATNNPQLNAQICAAAKQLNILVNVADTPHLCDFYLGSIVNKGNLKIAISTNGLSPTFAKRLRQVLQEALPDDLDQLLHNLHTVRNRLQGNFTHKAQQLNQLTQTLVEQ